MTIQEMNVYLKRAVNEASGISDVCKMNLVRLVERHFMVDLPNDNFMNIDFTLVENGNIIMRDVEYETKHKIYLKEDLDARFNRFKEDVDKLLDRNETNFSNMRKKNELSNLLIVVGMTFVLLMLLDYAFSCLMIGNFKSLIFLVIIICVYFGPYVNVVKKRYKRAFKYLKDVLNNRQK
jgi:hypothetical protein